jgi:hypothetical protein
MELMITTTAFVPYDWFPAPTRGELRGDHRNLGGHVPRRRLGSSRIWTWVQGEIDGSVQESPETLNHHLLNHCEYRDAPGHAVKKVAGTSCVSQHVTRVDGRSVQAAFDVAARLPEELFPMASPPPAIRYALKVWLEIDLKKSTVCWTAEGEHDGFPAYEIWLENALIYGYDPRGAEASAPLPESAGKARIVYGEPAGISDGSAWTRNGSGRVTVSATGSARLSPQRSAWVLW